jgi:hypothetical protein
MDKSDEGKSVEEKLKDILAGATHLPPTANEIVFQIRKTLCEENCLRSPRLVFDEKSLGEMVNNLNADEREALIGYLSFFQVYMEPLFLFTQEGRGKSWAVRENVVRSNLALHVIFSIVEDRTKPEHSKDFTTYLKEHLDQIKTKNDIDALAAEHRERFPKNARRVMAFYGKFLNEGERAGIVNDYKNKQRSENGKKFDSIEAVVDDIYGSMRSAFSHSLGTEHLWKDNYRLFFESAEKGGNLVAAYPELSVDRFLALSWLAVLRSFEYPV